ncbi:MAG TPA: D-alanyl-D-alanine carboxypeptidase, partial [Burkholderiales bacterium]|nr:D-alanyl-D-alanine carboxypeptidase [Burkholderiales bacterium]
MVRATATRALFVLLACFCALLSLPGVAQTSLPAPVSRALVKAGIPESGVGVYVQPVDAERPIVAYGADRALNPGSTIKVLTTYAALELLGPAFYWNTEIYSDGALKDGVLTGNLLIKGYGDPQLTLENFWLLLRALRARGVRDIRGDIVLDRTYFTREAYDPGRFDDQPTRPYNTGPDALLVNFKAITVRFLPDPEARAVQVV